MMESRFSWMDSGTFPHLNNVFPDAGLPTAMRYNEDLAIFSDIIWSLPRMESTISCSKLLVIEESRKGVQAKAS